MNIQEAAEKYYGNRHDHTPYREYERHVTHYESLMRAAGYEWVKVEGDDDEIVKSLGNGLPEILGYEELQMLLKKALAIGRQQEDKWIRVEDKPKESGRYLCCEDWNKRGVPFVAYFDKEDDMFYQKCTHWQPLPSPPKTDKP